MNIFKLRFERFKGCTKKLAMNNLNLLKLVVLK